MQFNVRYGTQLFFCCCWGVFFVEEAAIVFLSPVTGWIMYFVWWDLSVSYSALPWQSYQISGTYKTVFFLFFFIGVGEKYIDSVRNGIWAKLSFAKYVGSKQETFLEGSHKNETFPISTKPRKERKTAKINVNGACQTQSK